VTAQMPLGGLLQVPGWWPRVRQTVCRARDEQLCSVYKSGLGAKKKLTARADENGGGGSETAMTLDSPEIQSRSDAGAMTVGYGAKSPRSGNYDVHVSASSAARAQRVTTHEKVQVEYSSWTSCALQGRALPHARVECFATFALGAAADDVGFYGVVGSAEPLEKSWRCLAHVHVDTSVALRRSGQDGTFRALGMHLRSDVAIVGDAPPFLFRDAASAG
jgi:hypothetical protein